jgi:hypothetical protein
MRHAPANGAHERESHFPLARLCDGVETRLPWLAATDGRPMGMRVLSSGYLEWNHPLFPIGTPYVELGVDSWEAAQALRKALAPVARLDTASWDLDWEHGAYAFRQIRIFPDPRALGLGDL